MGHPAEVVIARDYTATAPVSAVARQASASRAPATRLNGLRPEQNPTGDGIIHEPEPGELGSLAGTVSAELGSGRHREPAPPDQALIRPPGIRFYETCRWPISS